jgi:hypothetical protein
MAIRLSGLAAWTEAQQALAENLGSALELLQNAPYSADAGSPYQQAQAAAQQLTAEAKRLAVLGLEEIDEAIASGGLVAEINETAARVKNEADLLARAAKTVANVTAAVGSVTDLITKVGALPFLRPTSPPA